MFMRFEYLLLIFMIPWCSSDHFMGGSITWRPISSTSLANPVQMIITVRGAWTSSRYPCNQTDMNSNALLYDTTNLTIPNIYCISDTTNCSSSGFLNITQQFYCSDYSEYAGYSFGSFYVKQNLTLGSNIQIASRGSSWTSDTNVNSWSLVSRINLTPVSNKINSSPGSNNVFYLIINQRIYLNLFLSF